MPGTDVNPYAAPLDVDAPPVDPRKQSLAKLRGPTSGLLVLSAVWILMGASAFVLGLLSLFDGSAGPLYDAFGFGKLIAVLASNVFIVIGTFLMRQGRLYRIAFAAAVVASIPALSPFIWLGIPLGIWALVVLRRPEVRAAFDGEVSR